MLTLTLYILFIAIAVAFEIFICVGYHSYCTIDVELISHRFGWQVTQMSPVRLAFE